MERLQREALENGTGFDVGHDATIEPLRDGRYQIVPENLTGDAPKAFIHVYEHQPGVTRRNRPHKWPLYIAKVGHKWYPNESITEHLLTRLGEFLGVRMAHSRLMNAHGQIRFLSRFFLSKDQILVHGAQIFAGHLEDEDFVDAVEEANASRDVFTFQVVEQAIQGVFPEQASEILNGFVRMLGFDAIVGNNDRHYYNWGVVMHARGAHPPYFSPVYDSARALFWNDSEAKIAERWHNAHPKQREIFLKKYIKRSYPKTGCDDEKTPNHFKLIERICSHSPSYHAVLKDLYRLDLLQHTSTLFETEFSNLFSSQRKDIILACLARRLEQYGTIVQKEVPNHDA